MNPLLLITRGMLFSQSLAYKGFIPLEVVGPIIRIQTILGVSKITSEVVAPTDINSILGYGGFGTILKEKFKEKDSKKRRRIYIYIMLEDGTEFKQEIEEKEIGVSIDNIDATVLKNLIEVKFSGLL
jgi:hypothetical protein